jgi:hypothetical protein
MRLSTKYAVMSSPAPGSSDAEASDVAPPAAKGESSVDFNAAFAERARQVAAEDAVDVGRMASAVGSTARGTLKSTLDSINGAIDPSLRSRASDEQLKAKGLLNSGEWDATLLALGAVVVVAVLSQISFSASPGQIGLQAEPGAYIR